MIDQPLLNNVPEGEPESLEVYELKQRIAELEKLCKECADYIDINRCSSIGYNSVFHKQLREQAKGGAE